ncbi:hypothetical protein [Taibaiella chishuiensis]|uniref:hypothetical protein n=1 Tax=Taibaiella chishuiensis TaxID=1434707 RepID=UPI000D0D95D6|nr:hypothetical protein [Taibaiella chishuiensis]
MKVIVVINKAISYLPISWLVIFGFFIFRAYRRLGYFPKYNHPDPKDLGMPINYSIVFWGLYIVIFSAIFWLITTLGVGVVNKKKINAARGGLYILFYLIIVFLLRSETLGFGEWLLD